MEKCNTLFGCSPQSLIIISCTFHSLIFLFAISRIYIERRGEPKRLIDFCNFGGHIPAAVQPLQLQEKKLCKLVIMAESPLLEYSKLIMYVVRSLII